MKRSEMIWFIQSLNGDEASRVLSGLLTDDPLLTKKMYDMAVKISGDVNVDAIEDQVFSELNSLDIEDLNGRAGRTRYGYLEPVDAAWELFEETLNPFIDEMKKNQQRALPAATKAYCIGIINGLLRYKEGASSDLADWLPDAPCEYIDTVLEEWKKGNPDDDDVAEVIRIAKGGQA